GWRSTSRSTVPRASIPASPSVRSAGSSSCQPSGHRPGEALRLNSGPRHPAARITGYRSFFQHPGATATVVHGIAAGAAGGEDEETTGHGEVLLEGLPVHQFEQRVSGTLAIMTDKARSDAEGGKQQRDDGGLEADQQQARGGEFEDGAGHHHQLRHRQPEAGEYLGGAGDVGDLVEAAEKEDDGQQHPSGQYHRAGHVALPLAASPHGGVMDTSPWMRIRSTTLRFRAIPPISAT